MCPVCGIEKINKFAPIKHILKNQYSDDQKIIELLDTKVKVKKPSGGYFLWLKLNDIDVFITAGASTDQIIPSQATMTLNKMKDMKGM